MAFAPEGWVSMLRNIQAADVTVTAPANYEISLTSGSYDVLPLVLTQTAGTLASTTVYVRLKAGLTVATYDESITLTSYGVATHSVALSGKVSDVPTTTGFNTSNASLIVSSLNGNIILTAAAGERVEVYNALGQKLLSNITTVEGLNTIAVAAHGVVVVRVGNRVAKLVL